MASEERNTTAQPEEQELSAQEYNELVAVRRQKLKELQELQLEMAE